MVQNGSDFRHEVCNNHTLKRSSQRLNIFNKRSAFREYFYKKLKLTHPILMYSQQMVLPILVLAQISL